MAADKWQYEPTDEDIKVVENINVEIVDLVKATSGGATGKQQKGKSGGSKGQQQQPQQPQQPQPGGQPQPPQPPQPPQGQPAGGPNVKGAHSTKSERQRGIEDKFKHKYNLIDATRWVRSGNSRPSWDNIITSDKWQKFKPVKQALKKRWNELTKEEICDYERGNFVGEEIDWDDYIAERPKYFNKETVPDKDDVELNIILALDASGSTGSHDQYQMSGVSFAIKRAFEELRVRHSFMVYSDDLAIVDVDRVGLSTNANCLMGNYVGSGGTNESMVLDVTKEIVKMNRDMKNVVIMISDGSCSDVTKALADMKKSTNGDVNAYCIGYGDGFDGEYAKEIWGDKFALHTRNAKELAAEMVKLLNFELESAIIVDGY